MQTLMSRTLVLVGALALASAVHAADAPQGVRITDAATLAFYGFPPDAVVYLGPGVGMPEPPQYGGASSSMVSHAGTQFHGRISTYAYNTSTGQGDAVFTAGDVFADAQVVLPSGAIWESTRFWLNDAVASDINVFLFQSCLPVAGPGVPVATILGTAATTATPGDVSFVVTVAPATTINNNGCIYWERTNFGGAGTILRKSRTQYKLQVSPAPAVATFPSDVPTTNPFFRFVEAMAASGLTGGCGPGAFCPDSPVTRGQLSVFLSVALGLHFPN